MNGSSNSDIQVFFELMRAGLWRDQSSTHEFKSSLKREATKLNVMASCFVDWRKVYQLAQDQSVQGLVLHGIECYKNKNNIDNPNLNVNIPQLLLLQWIGEVQITEQNNLAMNAFIAELIVRLRKDNIYVLLVKGQGIAQCYENPLWRSSGDIDLLLSESDYKRAKDILRPLATKIETEYTHFLHQGMKISGWEVELHGSMRSRLSKRVDDGIDATQREVFYGGKVRSWMNDKTQVFLPAPDEDVIFVFTHILHHFFFEGIGLRQICDWCRLLWTYKDNLNKGLLESRIRTMGLMTEWKAFAAFAVKWLGMPVEGMPLYSSSSCWKRKADRICSFVMEVGNFGHNKLIEGYWKTRAHGYYCEKFLSFWVRLHDMLRHFRLFPKDSIVFIGGVIRSGLHAALRGE